MLKKVLLGVLTLILIVSIGLFFWVRSVFMQDTVREALAGQLSRALGQPVKVGSIAATVYPRVTVNLGQVAIGDPARITVQTLHVGTDFRALLSRRIEHARLELSGAHVELPLPDFAIAAGSTSGPSSSPVDIVSIDAIVLHGVEIVSGGRAVTGDVEVVPEGKGVLLQKVVLRADTATIDVSGRLTDLSGPVGDLTVKAGALNFDRLLAFVNDFASGAAPTGAPQPAPASTAAASTATAGAAATAAPPMNVSVSLAADRATMGELALDQLAGQARITSDAMTLDPIGFGVFGGHYNGALTFTLGTVPDIRLKAALTGIDIAAATAFLGSPNTITGRLSGNLDVTGRGMAAASIMTTARGTARVDIADGVVKNLGLVRSVVLLTSGRTDVAPESAAAAARTGRDEPFTKLGGTLAIAGGSATTDDLRFESPSLLLAVAGAVRLAGDNINLNGRLQLSDELSKQAGRDLVRYTQEEGRVTLPATITGTAAAPHVQIDVASMAKRALTNRAGEEVQKALKNRLGGLFGNK